MSPDPSTWVGSGDKTKLSLWLSRINAELAYMYLVVGLFLGKCGSLIVHALIHVCISREICCLKRFVDMNAYLNNGP